MLNKRARKIIGYDGLVQKLAAAIPKEEIEYLETEQLKEMLGSGYENWEFSDLIRLIHDIKREQQKNLHDLLTVEAIMAQLPYASRHAAQKAVTMLVEKAKEDKLFKIDNVVSATVDILWSMFYCMGIDIKDTAKKMRESNLYYSYNDLKDNKLLYDFIRILRDIQWYKHGDVAQLRTRENL